MKLSNKSDGIIVPKKPSTKTTPIVIRPFIPGMKNEEADGREPFAILKYGNVEIELDYTILRCLELNTVHGATLAYSGIKEIVNEMHLDMYNQLPELHRDSNHRHVLDEYNNPLHPRSPFHADNLKFPKGIPKAML